LPWSWCCCFDRTMEWKKKKKIRWGERERRNRPPQRIAYYRCCCCSVVFDVRPHSPDYRAVYNNNILRPVYTSNQQMQTR
jgi:hypothetical protein